MTSKRTRLDWSDAPHMALLFIAIVCIILFWTAGIGPPSFGGKLVATLGAAILGCGSALNLWHELRPRR